ncbi:CocE/NonD family hydrolase [Glacieibacterium megasporae]|uniref:CocE/NonD family hydrolase n=1 Tax=Glacieibacterium megasporae TaxID=2835787 RepID=UPI001C1E03A0|nr:CocE/NonD family hydrolase [Polymorphobacter megasporae]UAJ11277.1 CocE/NonD family hydrolase [Polymorphobacter megasporae]
MKILALTAVLATHALAAPAPAITALTPDIPKHFTNPTSDAAADYVKRTVEIPMRDGVKLHTVIVVPKGATHAGIILTRTPYHADKRAERNVSPSMVSMLPQGDEIFAAAGYIRVFQDVRGKYKSGGEYVMVRPVRGPLNPTKVDHGTDAWDTIDWLVKNVPESNGKVGMIGSSYEGMTVLMALTDPHPALKVAIPMSPMVDGWRGDDWFHNGAFRQNVWGYHASQTEVKDDGDAIAQGVYDDYTAYLRAGSSGDYARKYGLADLPYSQKVMQHPAYDSFWSEQALDKTLAAHPPHVATMLIVGRWDQEDIYGAYAVYAALKPLNVAPTYLVVGPWRHSGVNYDGSSLGPIKFTGDTALEFRRDVMQPFLDQYLKDDAPKAATPPVWSYETGTNKWRRLDSWPKVAALKPLYLQANMGLGFGAAAEGHDDYVSDPAHPIPFVPRPVRMEDRSVWTQWLVTDQRPANARTDVLSYVGPVLTAPVHIAGQSMVNLFAATTGTDADWVIKLIDVYPDEVPSQPELGGYQLPIALDIFRGRYRDSLSAPTAIPVNVAQKYRFALPNADHVFLPGHRIMVQIQSSLFPLYDRNPQTFVSNIFDAKPGDYRAATESVLRGGATASAIELPVVE